MTRKLEVVMSLLIGIFSLVFLGGYALTMSQLNQNQFEKTLYLTLGEGVSAKGPVQAYTELKTLSVWLGMTLILTLLGLVISSYLIGHNRRPKMAAIAYTLTGFILLVGSQLLAYPLAFVCFMLAALSVLRKDGGHPKVLKRPISRVREKGNSQL